MEDFFTSKPGSYFIENNTLKFYSARANLDGTSDFPEGHRDRGIIKLNSGYDVLIQLATKYLRFNLVYKRGKWNLHQHGGNYGLLKDFIKNMGRMVNIKIVNFTDEEFIELFTTIFNAVEDIINYIASIRFMPLVKKVESNPIMPS